MADVWKLPAVVRLIRSTPDADNTLRRGSRIRLSRITRRNWLGRHILALLPGFIRIRPPMGRPSKNYSE